MNVSNNELDQLFESVRQEKPVATFDETQKAFIEATVISAGGVLATKGFLKFFNLKQWIMMISILSTATVGTLLVTMNAATVTPKNEVSTLKKKEVTIAPEVSEKATPENEKKSSMIAAVWEEVSDAPTREIQSETGATIQVRAFLKSDGTYHFVFVITPETTEEDLEELQEKATAAGFELVFEPRYKEEKLHYLSLQMHQKKDDGQVTNVVISEIDLEESPNYKVAWNVDENGKATTIACGEDFTSEGVDALLADLDLEELLKNAKTMKVDWEKEIALLDENGSRTALLAFQDEIENTYEVLVNDDLRASLLAVKIIDEEALENMVNDLADAKELLREFEEEIEVQWAEMKTDYQEMTNQCTKGHQELLDALLEDGLIKDKKKRVKMKAAKGKMAVNGKEIPKELRKKYEGLVKEYFNVDLKKQSTQWTWVHDEN